MLLFNYGVIADLLVTTFINRRASYKKQLRSTTTDVTVKVTFAYLEYI